MSTAPAPKTAGRRAPKGPPPGAALDRAVLYLTWLVPQLESLPRSQRFLLGDRWQGLAMEVVELLVEATYTKAPQAILRRANLALEKQRVLSRVAYNLRYLDVKRYEGTARQLDEIGQRVGAWLKAGAAAGTGSSLDPA